MKEVLSQSEIDALLNALSSGELDVDEVRPKEEMEVKPYDFRRPNKFSQEQLRALHLMHENFARLITNFLSAYLRSNIQFKIFSVNQLTYEDFIVSIPTPTLLTIFSMDPLPGNAILESNSAFIFPVIDLLFGGSGTMGVKIRELTDIEKKVLEKLNSKVLENLTYIWSDIYQIKTKVLSMETNPRLSQIISPNETVAVITLSAEVAGQESMINICLPFMTLEPVVSRLSARQWLTGKVSKKTVDLRREMECFLKNVPVDLTVLGGETEVKIKDFLQMELGDVIPLGKLVSEDLVVYVNEKPKFYVQPGRIENKLAVQVTEVL